jgi:formate dehydrogenase alpha subunit
MTNSINEIEDAELIMVTGSNTSEQHPIVGSRIIEAVSKGAKLIVIDPRKIPLVAHAHLYLQQECGTDVAYLNGMMHVIIKEGLADQEFISRRTQDFESLKETVVKYTPEYVEEITGIPAQDLIEAARLYATTKKAMLFYCMGITQHITGVDNVKSCANLAMLTGHLGQEGMGVNPLRGQNNVQGSCDMGGLPNVFSGYQQVADEAARAKFSKAWGVELSGQPGMTLTEMLAECGKKIKALYIMGENPVVSDPDTAHVKDKLSKLDFMVVQDIFLTETAQMADVVLPGTSFAESDGTFSNTERRVQRVRRAIPPIGQAREDWVIICKLASKMGYPMDYESAEEIMDEISLLTPSYGGINYKRLESIEGLQWPCPNTEHPGTPVLHRKVFTSGKGKFFAIDFKPPAEVPDAEFPYILTTGRNAFQYHTATMTGQTAVLQREFPENYVEINPADAKEIGVRDGWDVEVSSRRGKVTCYAMVTDMVPSKTLFMPFHYAASSANLLTNPVFDPVAKIPEYKVCAAQIRGV